MKKRIRSSHPTTLRTDRQHLVRIQMQELESLAASMPKRIAAVIQAKDVTF